MAARQGNLGTIRNEVLKKLRLTVADDGDLIDTFINTAYQQAVQTTGCLQRSGTATLTNAVASYDLPASVAWIRLLTISYSDGSFSDPLKQVTLEEILQQRRLNTAVAQTVVTPLYALVGQNQLELWPTPGTGQSMGFWYVYLPDELTSDSDEPAILEPYGSQLLTYGACVEAAIFKHDLLMLGQYQQDYAAGLARFQVWLNRREGLSAATLRVRSGGERTRVTNRSADLGG